MLPVSILNVLNAGCWYAECSYDYHYLSGIMLSVVMLSVVMLSVIMLSVLTLSGIMQIVML